MRSAVVMVAVLCGCVACSAQETTTQKEIKVTREELGNAWPFTVPEGTLACREGQEVVFTANNKTYAVNHVAASSKKYADLDAIWEASPLTPATRKDNRRDHRSRHEALRIVVDLIGRFRSSRGV